MTQPSYQLRHLEQPDTLNWGRISGLAFAVTVQAALFMMLLVPPSFQNNDKDKDNTTAATIIEPPPKPPPPPPPPPENIKTPQPKDIPPPPRPNVMPPPPTPPVIFDTPTPVSTPAPPPSPPARPVEATNVGASIDLSYQQHNPPEYPREELAQEITGTVTLLVTVSDSGEALDVRVERSSRNRNLDRAAVEAAKKWRFNPGVEGGKRVGGVARVTVEFKL